MQQGTGSRILERARTSFVSRYQFVLLLHSVVVGRDQRALKVAMPEYSHVVVSKDVLSEFAMSEFAMARWSGGSCGLGGLIHHSHLSAIFRLDKVPVFVRLDLVRLVLAHQPQSSSRPNPTQQHQRRPDNSHLGEGSTPTHPFTHTPYNADRSVQSRTIAA